ncbi:twin-arginine translocation signal domain-containing protein [Achromobacter sp. Marseille-Q4962]|uniref:TRAP transporter substrate-binding protein n=1 Tax=Achromobacter sp. Marseille-Q4962 TaxID=2942202 RepID=UPI0020735E3E|nr:twin-arginine translocation signal domain-containing protein [Achromobacter sp. Marseille-Q4962]
MQRRAFLKQTALGAAAGGAALAAPVVAQTAPSISWRLASSFPYESPTLFAGAEDVARYLSDVTDGRFQIEIFPAGDLAPAGQVLQAVSDRVADCGHTASTRYFDIDPALCFDGAVPFGLNTRQMHAWMIQGNGLALTRVLFDKHNILNFPCGYTGAQMGGWFRPEIKTADDFRGLKVKAGGFARQVLARLGATPVDVAAPDAYTALEQGEVDAVAWIGPYDDEGLALYKVARNYYFPGWWAGTLQLSLYVNQDAYDELPKSYQSALELACRMASGNMLAKYDAGNPDALHRLVSRGAQLKAFPRPVLQACRDASLQLYDELGAKDPMFKKLYESMKSFRDKQAPWFRLAETSFDNLGLSLGPDASSG